MFHTGCANIIVFGLRAAHTVRYPGIGIEIESFQPGFLFSNRERVAEEASRPDSISTVQRQSEF
ncbi:hypothetical protein MB02_12555 [Croceicoccus estronivorus]|nr:hypothetical protein MB02_12555 [Croceicoccus estronivorus]